MVISKRQMAGTSIYS